MPIEDWSILLHTMNNSLNEVRLNSRQLIAFCWFAVLLLHAATGMAQEQAPPLLVMISEDGMRPDYITEADAHGAKIPNLRRFLKGNRR